MFGLENPAEVLAKTDAADAGSVKVGQLVVVLQFQHSNGDR